MGDVSEGTSASETGGSDGIWRAIRRDFRSSRPLQRVALAAVAFWLFYEWGAGNETVTPWLVAHTIASTSGFSSIVVTVAIGFAFTFVQQSLSGFTALVGFSMFDRTADAAWRRLRRGFSGDPPRWRDLGLLSRGALVFGLGTTAVVLLEVVTSGSAEARRHRSTVVASAALVATVVGAISGIFATAAVLGRRYDSLSGTVDTLLRVFSNPLLWITVALTIIVVRGLSAARSTPRTADELPDPSTT